MDIIVIDKEKNNNDDANNNLFKDPISTFDSTEEAGEIKIADAEESIGSGASVRTMKKTDERIEDLTNSNDLIPLSNDVNANEEKCGLIIQLKDNIAILKKLNDSKNEVSVLGLCNGNEKSQPLQSSSTTQQDKDIVEIMQCKPVKGKVETAETISFSILSDLVETVVESELGKASIDTTGSGCGKHTDKSKIAKAGVLVAPLDQSNSKDPPRMSKRKRVPKKVDFIEEEQEQTKPVVVVKEKLPLVETPIVYKLGDLVWSYVPGHPLWPCMLTQDPIDQLSTKMHSCGVKGTRAYHVQFLGDSPERGWILESRIFPYSGSSDYEKIINELAAKNKKAKSKIPRMEIPTRLKDDWESGMEEITEGVRLSAKQRIEKFGYDFKPFIKSLKRLPHVKGMAMEGVFDAVGMMQFEVNGLFSKSLRETTLEDDIQQTSHGIQRNPVTSEVKDMDIDKKDEVSDSAQSGLVCISQTMPVISDWGHTKIVSYLHDTDNSLHPSILSQSSASVLSSEILLEPDSNVVSDEVLVGFPSDEKLVQSEHSTSFEGPSSNQDASIKLLSQVENVEVVPTQCDDFVITSTISLLHQNGDYGIKSTNLSKCESEELEETVTDHSCLEKPNTNNEPLLDGKETMLQGYHDLFKLTAVTDDKSPEKQSMAIEGRASDVVNDTNGDPCLFDQYEKCSCSALQQRKRGTSDRIRGPRWHTIKDLLDALRAICNGFSLSVVASSFYIHRSTLQGYMKGTSTLSLRHHANCKMFSEGKYVLSYGAVTHIRTMESCRRIRLTDRVKTDKSALMSSKTSADNEPCTSTETASSFIKSIEIDTLHDIEKLEKNNWVAPSVIGSVPCFSRRQLLSAWKNYASKSNLEKYRSRYNCVNKNDCAEQNFRKALKMIIRGKGVKESALLLNLNLMIFFRRLKFFYGLDEPKPLLFDPGKMLSGLDDLLSGERNNMKEVAEIYDLNANTLKLALNKNKDLYKGLLSGNNLTKLERVEVLRDHWHLFNFDTTLLSRSSKQSHHHNQTVYDTNQMLSAMDEVLSGNAVNTVQTACLNGIPASTLKDGLLKNEKIYRSLIIPNMTKEERLDILRKHCQNLWLPSSLMRDRLKFTSTDQEERKDILKLLPSARVTLEKCTSLLPLTTKPAVFDKSESNSPVKDDSSNKDLLEKQNNLEKVFPQVPVEGSRRRPRRASAMRYIDSLPYLYDADDTGDTSPVYKSSNKRVHCGRYSPGDLKIATDEAFQHCYPHLSKYDVLNRGSILATARKYHIPFSTLYDKVQKRKRQRSRLRKRNKSLLFSNATGSKNTIGMQPVQNDEPEVSNIDGNTCLSSCQTPNDELKTLSCLRKCSYSKEDMDMAVFEANKGEVSITLIARKYNIPNSTLRNKVLGRGGNLVSWQFATRARNIQAVIQSVMSWGWFYSCDQLKTEVTSYFNNLGDHASAALVTSAWMRNFCLRHQIDCVNTDIERDHRKPDPLYLFRFFDTLEKQIDLLGLKEIPSNVYLLHEFVLDASESSQIRILAAVNAAGEKYPPLLIFKANSLWCFGSDAFPGSQFALSQDGGLNHDIHLEWFRNFFNTIQRKPILLIYDGVMKALPLGTLEEVITEGQTVILKLPFATEQCSFMLPYSNLVSQAKLWYKKNVFEASKEFTNSEVTGSIRDLWSYGLTTETIVSAFDVSGIFPTDREKYPAEIFYNERLQEYENRRSEQHFTSIPSPKTKTTSTGRILLPDVSEQGNNSSSESVADQIEQTEDQGRERKQFPGKTQDVASYNKKSGDRNTSKSRETPKRSSHSMKDPTMKKPTSYLERNKRRRSVVPAIESLRQPRETFDRELFDSYCEKRRAPILIEKPDRSPEQVEALIWMEWESLSSEEQQRYGAKRSTGLNKNVEDSPSPKRKRGRPSKNSLQENQIFTPVTTPSSPSSEKPEQFGCNACDAVYSSRFSLGQHKRWCLGSHRAKDVVSKKVSQVTDSTSDLEETSSVCSFVCTNCQDSFHSSMSLQIHKKFCTRPTDNRRVKYPAAFKLEVIEHATKSNNSVAAKKHGVSEKMVRDWIKNLTLIKVLPKNKYALRFGAVQWPQLEESLKEWFLMRRRKGFNISRCDIRSEALRWAKANPNVSINFKGSVSWCNRFMKRKNLMIREKQAITQKLSERLIHKLLNFHRLMKELRGNHDFSLGQIGNMDKTLLSFDLVKNRAEELEEISLRQNIRYFKTQCSVILSCMADGTKLKPLIIFATKIMPKVKLPSDVFIHYDEKGLVDDQGVNSWIENVWCTRPEPNKNNILVYDASTSPYVTKANKGHLRKTNAEVAVVPEGLTPLLHPLSSLVYKSFKEHINKEWNKWIVSGKKSYTEEGDMNPPTMDILCNFVIKSWKAVQPETIVAAFKKCGLSNSIEGEDDTIWLEEDENLETSMAGEDCDDPFKPNDDETCFKEIPSRVVKSLPVLSEVKKPVSHSPSRRLKASISDDTSSNGSGKTEVDEANNQCKIRSRGSQLGSAKRENICLICEETGDNLVTCTGGCYQSFHRGCVNIKLPPVGEPYYCENCLKGTHPCFICKKGDDRSGNNNFGKIKRCSVPHCGKYYHTTCLQTKKAELSSANDDVGTEAGDRNSLTNSRCTLHHCATCISRLVDDFIPMSQGARCKMFKCIRCPTAYHAGDDCIAAGSVILPGLNIICPNHFEPVKAIHHHQPVHVSWCFICSKGGELVCCDSCPAAFHPSCVDMESAPEGEWFCRDCRYHRKPLYGDIVWVKLGSYRWWPGQVTHPNDIPDNISNLRHGIGEFVVKFFGSNDYFWLNQRRVFLYQEGDTGASTAHCSRGISSVFNKALKVARERFDQLTLQRQKLQDEKSQKQRPVYKYIKVNKPVGNVQVYTADLNEISHCICKRTDPNPCGPESECLNRMLMYECHPTLCPAGDKCQNQHFQTRDYPDSEVFKTSWGGWGLRTKVPVKKGQFVNEYVGELIDNEECLRRIEQAHKNNITNFYMLTIDKDRIIDAGPKGNLSRFMNHCCDPSCETQKWTVNGDTRVGLFARRDIAAGEELTFNYNLDCLGNDKTPCMCGSENCSGFIGVRPKPQIGNGNNGSHKGKRKRKRQDTKLLPRHDDFCFRCRQVGILVCCDVRCCQRAFCLSCLRLTKPPFGKWECPWHHCDFCGRRAQSFCHFCPNSYCASHVSHQLLPSVPNKYDCCTDHDPNVAEYEMEEAIAAIVASIMPSSENWDASIEDTNTEEYELQESDVTPVKALKSRRRRRYEKIPDSPSPIKRRRGRPKKVSVPHSTPQVSMESDDYVLSTPTVEDSDAIEAVTCSDDDLGPPTSSPVRRKRGKTPYFRGRKKRRSLKHSVGSSSLLSSEKKPEQESNHIKPLVLSIESAVQKFEITDEPSQVGNESF